METRAACAPEGLSPRRLWEAGPGLLLCAAVAVTSWELSRSHSSLDPLAVSLILGMVLRNALGPQASVQPGVKLASAVFVPLGIILYGARLNFGTFAGLPVYTSLLVIGCMVLFFAVILALTRKLGVDRRTGLLIASGSAICGASAIAVLSPVVGARSRETSIALIVTTAAGLTGVLIYPLVAGWLSLSDTAYGLFCGSTLQQTGVVKLAASHMGKSATAFAISIKMVRIAMLAPITVLLAAATSFTGRQPGRRWNGWSPASAAMKRAWFIPLFVGMALLFSFSDAVGGIKHPLDAIGTIFLSIALTSIGLGVDFDSIKDSGTGPLFAGFAGWFLVSALFLLLMIPLVT